MLIYLVACLVSLALVLGRLWLITAQNRRPVPIAARDGTRVKTLPK